MPLAIRKVKNGIQFPAFIQSGSFRNGIVGIHNDTLKIRLTAPPVYGKANLMCVKYLAKLLGIKSSRVSISSGPASRSKQIRIEEFNEDELMKKLQPAFEP